MWGLYRDDWQVRLLKRFFGNFYLLIASYYCWALLEMSSFSSELIDYLEGKISFEEFEILREERKAKDKVKSAVDV